MPPEPASGRNGRRRVPEDAARAHRIPCQDQPGRHRRRCSRRSATAAGKLLRRQHARTARASAAVPRRWRPGVNVVGAVARRRVGRDRRPPSWPARSSRSGTRSERLAHAFTALVPEIERRRQVLALARRGRRGVRGRTGLRVLGAVGPGQRHADVVFRRRTSCPTTTRASSRPRARSRWTSRRQRRSAGAHRRLAGHGQRLVAPRPRSISCSSIC